MESTIKNLRQERNLTQRELAKALNLSKSTIAMYETNQRKPDTDTLQIIADFFNVSTDYLLNRSDKKEISNNDISLSEKDEKDIAKQLEKTMELLNKQDSIMFDGEAMDEETKDLLRQSLENSMRMAKAINKKYTPKKHRK